MARGRDPVLREKGLRERFRSLEAGRGRARPEAGEPRGFETIDHACDERLLGADDRERDRFAAGERDEAVEIVRANRDVTDSRLACRSRVPRCDQHLVDERRLRRFPRDRMFAPAGADDEYLHDASDSAADSTHARPGWTTHQGLRRGQWRKWRMPVKTIAMPRSFAAWMTSASRTEPPGWITAVMPCCAATSRPSRNGKNASDAIAAPSREKLCSPAFVMPICAAITRLVWPPPMPSVRPSRA